MTHECSVEWCDRSFDTKVGRGLHESRGHKHPHQDPEILHQLYVEEGLSSREVAEQLDTSKQQVLHYLHELGFEVRPSTRDRPPHFKLTSNGYECWQHNTGGEYLNVYVHRLLAVSKFGFNAVCGKIVHHGAGAEGSTIPWDNRPSNIEIMANGEHVAEHHAQGDYDEHLAELHNKTEEEIRLARVPIERAGGDSG